MPAWMIQSGMCLVCFGLWGFFSKLALNSLTPKITLVLQSAGIMLVTLFLIKPSASKPSMPLEGSVFALLTGIAFAVGSILFFLATKEQGKISTIVTMTALYPLVTLGLAWIILHEPISFKQGLGMILALVAMWFMATA